jgi:hypothetical protein
MVGNKSERRVYPAIDGLRLKTAADKIKKRDDLTEAELQTIDMENLKRLLNELNLDSPDSSADNTPNQQQRSS